MVNPARSLSKPLRVATTLALALGLTALPTVAQADGADVTAPSVTTVSGTSYTVPSGSGYEKISFKLYDAGKVDKVVLNGVERDLANNVWSDLNFVKPGTFGAVLGHNTLEVFDVAGNVTTVDFVLNTKAPTVTVKDGDNFTARDGETYEKVSFSLFDAGKVDKVVLNGVVKDLADNVWSDLNFVKPGAFGAVLGENTLEVFDVAGNVTSVNFVLSATAPTVTVKDTEGYTITDGDDFEMVSFKLFDAGKVDKVVLNGVVKDLSNNAWSDLNFVKPGVFGAVLGDNTLEVFDISGNKTTVNFTLVLPRVTADTLGITSSLPRGWIKQGATLTVDEGTWSPTPQFSYQWFRDGVAIEWATGQSFKLAGARFPEGVVITVEVTGSAEGHRPTTVTHSVTTVR
ncbi:hypothetical protein FNH13_07325 [Ornithinimicrobium ciconiae]|uniref:Uncharacterized protein n=1 Tax=Ornithinimicrobium ciconiae TaxID=2594265 RepID=A0A516G9H2_9MICO|nr:hypothetical protein [Ornithinimicrobium ciconiae]QDO88176.1 hypothetical protein FNH13_07325 [Ornithinimicrobium ciconiae]